MFTVPMSKLIKIMFNVNNVESFFAYGKSVEFMHRTLSSKTEKNRAK